MLKSRRSSMAAAVIGAFASMSVIKEEGAPLFMAPPTTPRTKGRFYNLSESETEAGKKVVELQIYEEIGFWGMTAKDFIDQLQAAAEEADEILVAINSYGGDVLDAFAIYNALRRYDGKVTVRVDAIAASAASLIVMAGNTVVMPENAMLMIHNMWTVVGGEAEDLRKQADLMDKAKAAVVAAYVAKSGLPEEEVSRLMDEETWMTALEAQSYGFADIIEEPVKLQASARTHEMLGNFSKVPATLLNQVKVTSQPIRMSSTKPTSIRSTSSSLVAHTIQACKREGIGHLSESIMLTMDMSDASSIDERVAECKQIATMCAAAKLPEMADSFVKLNMSVEQARARLFNKVTSGAALELNNRQTPNPQVVAKAGPNANTIYASRRTTVATKPSTRK